MQNFDSIMSGAAISQQQPSWMDMPIKSEPLDASISYQHYGHHYQNHLQQQQQHQQDTPMSHSSPTSPQSVDSMDSIKYYESKPSGMMHGYNPLGFNPLTPPGYAGMFVPTQQNQQQRQTTPNRSYGKQDSGYVSSTLTPTHTPPMDVTPPKSPKDNVETPKKDEDISSDCEESYDGSDDEDGIRKPKINSHGKVKKFKCKQCEFVAVTKLSFWEHTRSHIKPEKMLNCPKCPFVTEYKHHLEYHMRNHDRSKPFQCPKCSYSCVNKSMLNSHMKSHSNVFQYRCADCNYATKYCHSLKLHLRKYAHKPDVVLNMDGTPNPLPIIDVYGTRRGPKTKPQKPTDSKPQEAQQQTQQAPLTPQSHPQTPTQLPFTPPSSQSNLSRNLLPHQLLPNPLAHMFKNANNLPLFPYLNLNFQMFADQQAAINQLSPNFHQTFHDKPEPTSSPSKNTSSSSSTLSEELLKRITAAAADSSDFKPDAPSSDMDHQTTAEDLTTVTAVEPPLTPSTGIRSAGAAGGSTGKSRRKGRAFKLERLTSSPSAMEHSDDGGEDPSDGEAFKEPVVVKSSESSVAVATTPSPPPAVPEMRFRCAYCEIGFEHEVMYTIHMGWHGYDDVFKCNMCGEKCDDRISFQLHMVRKAHPK